MNENYINRISDALKKLFDRHRIVFWYDEGATMYDIFQSLDLEGVSKLEIDGNAFSLKYNMVVANPDSRFIVYSRFAVPDNEANWLLDLQLAGGMFYADLSSLYAGECHIPMELRSEIVDGHEAFFKVAENRSALAEKLTGSEKKQAIEWCMLLIACRCDGTLDDLLFALFEEEKKGKSTLYKRIVSYKLEDTLWNKLSDKFRYNRERGVKNLIIVLFQADLQRYFGSAELAGDALLFMSKWKDSSRHSETFTYWSHELEQDLNIASVLMQHPVESILKIDTYACVNWIVATALQSHILNNTIAVDTAEKWIAMRQQLLFFNEAEHTLLALLEACRMLDEVRKSDFSVTSAAGAFQTYYKQWFLIDQHYRHYFQQVAQAENASMLGLITEQIQNVYSNSYLLVLNNNWQCLVDRLDCWQISGITPQTSFYNSYVKPYIEQKKRIFVVISDALRYESMVELDGMIAGLNMFSTSMCTPMLGMIPSYTQLGMAALLPHQMLSYENDNDIVFADGVSTQGTDQRTKVLQSAYKESIALTAETFLSMSSKDAREFFKDFNVIYIYSNVIDKAGDNKTSEGTVFAATQDELNHIVRMVKHIGNCNGSNMLITADHGYLYQNEQLEESDFADFKPMGEVFKVNRRFVIGNNLVEGKAVKTWRSEQLGLKPGVMLQTAKSISRIKVQGAGSRFVHGGSSLQEVVVPVLEVNRSRKTDISQVGIDVIGGASRITSNQHTVSFYQTEPMSEKVKARSLRMGFYDDKGGLISDLVTLVFDSMATESVLREKKHTFTFKSSVSRLNGKEVELRLEELISGSDQYKLYKMASYRMSILFSAEF